MTIVMVDDDSSFCCIHDGYSRRFLQRFVIDECAIDEYDWITIDVYEIKHDFISISTKHCRMS